MRIGQVERNYSAFEAGTHRLGFGEPLLALALFVLRNFRFLVELPDSSTKTSELLTAGRS